MCFHLALSKTAQEVENRYNARFTDGEAFKPIYHASGFTFLKYPVITAQQPDIIHTYNWGLIPSWVKTKEDAKKMRQFNLNARSETIFEKPSFSKSVHSKRCLIPSSGFFEWRDCRGKKYPYFIYLENINIFSLAGIHEEWVDTETGELINTFSIITTQANPFMAKIHNTKLRMPVVLQKENEMNWLNMNLSQKELENYFLPIPYNTMQAHTISRLITDPKQEHNIPEIIQPAEYPELDKI